MYTVEMTTRDRACENVAYIVLTNGLQSRWIEHIRQKSAAVAVRGESPWSMIS